MHRNPSDSDTASGTRSAEQDFTIREKVLLRDLIVPLLRASSKGKLKNALLALFSPLFASEGRRRSWLECAVSRNSCIGCWSERLPRQPAGTERGLKIVAADRTVEVEDFAGEVQVGAKFALHRLRVDFAKVDTAGSDFGFFEAL